MAGKFAEFGINLSEAGIIPRDDCKAFPQTVWESRSSGSSFVSSTKDVTIEDHTISNCAGVSVTKEGSDGGSQAGAVFTLYEGSDTDGTVVGTCTIQADGTCDSTFTDLNPGQYTIDETTVPAGYDKDPTLPYMFTLDANQSLTLSFTDPAKAGAIEITKVTSKDHQTGLGDAEFTIEDSNGVEIVGSPFTSGQDGTVCVDNLAFDDYTVTETMAPDGYEIDDDTGQTVTVDTNSECGDGNEAAITFEDTPLTDVTVTATSQVAGGTASTITCTDANGDDIGNSPVGDPDPVDPAEVDANDLLPGTYDCTIVIDP